MLRIHKVVKKYSAKNFVRDGRYQPYTQVIMHARMYLVAKSKNVNFRIWEEGVAAMSLSIQHCWTFANTEQKFVT